MNATTMEVFIDTREYQRYQKDKHARGRQRKQRLKDPDHKRCTLKDACHHFNGMHIYNLLSRRQALANALRRDARWPDAEDVDSTPFYQYTLGDVLGVDSVLAYPTHADHGVKHLDMLIKLFGLHVLLDIVEATGLDPHTIDAVTLLELIGWSEKELEEIYDDYYGFSSDFLEDALADQYEDELTDQYEADLVTLDNLTQLYDEENEEVMIDFLDFLESQQEQDQQEQLCSVSIHADIPLDELQALPDLFEFLQSLGAKNISVHTEL